MNLILFEAAETATPLPRADPRARHLLDVLRRQPGDTFDAGLVNGPRGKGTLVALGADALTLAFAWGEEPPALPPITLLIGLPRPQTARDLLRDATTLGVAALHFVATEKCEPSYARSTLWTSGEWRRHVLAGAAQAFDTRLPEISWTHTLAEAVACLEPGRKDALPAGGTRLALDNYEAAQSLGECLLNPAAHAAGHGMEAALRVSAGSDMVGCELVSQRGAASAPPTPVVLAFGPERGWGAGDRALLRAQGFTLAHLGARPLRAETAVVAALAVLRIGRA
jgi:16S rRNA (uracil1498-N3)-methyltransferase